MCANNNVMLTSAELEVVAYLKKQDCMSGYKIVEIDDIINFLQSKDYSLTKSEVKSLLNNLANEKFITIKYFDENVVCLNLLKIEKIQSQSIIQTKNNKKEQAIYIYIALICVFCSFFGCLFANFIFLLFF